MPHAVYYFDDFIVSVDIEDCGLVDSRTVEVCGQVTSRDGKFDQKVCAKLPLPQRAYEEAVRKAEEEYCSDADNPEMCIEYYEDHIKERAIELIDPETACEYVEWEAAAEALIYAAMDEYSMRKKKTLLDFMK